MRRIGEIKMRQEVSSFCEQNEAKKLHSFGPDLATPRFANGNRLFCVFFLQKKEGSCLLETPL
jgi:hypothetical protein